MNTEEFNKHCEDVINHCTELLIGKCAEYSEDIDRLANFKRPTTMMETNQAEVCLWYDMKHIASMAKIAKDINEGKYPSKELLMEKVGDYVNYGLLFYANVMEILNNKEQ